MGLLSFLFGKQTNIFNSSGQVEHDLGSDKWKSWNNRLKANPDYNWREHKGKSTASHPAPQNTAKKNQTPEG